MHGRDLGFGGQLVARPQGGHCARGKIRCGDNLIVGVICRISDDKDRAIGQTNYPLGGGLMEGRKEGPVPMGAQNNKVRRKFGGQRDHLRGRMSNANHDRMACVPTQKTGAAP